VRILFVGADFERKGGQHVLQAFQKLPHGAAELVLVTRSQVPETPGVRAVHGLQPNSPALISLYQSSDVFVFPSRAEAFGIAAVEASAAGLPVIASGVGGLKDIVDAGKTGLIVSPDDPEELLHALTSLIDDPEQRETMGRAARNRAVQYFDARANANRIIELILQE
jgi:glycosyltransferase involved in cell wall biosynthesis